MSGSESKRFAWVGGMIVVAIALVYAQVSGHAFVEFDDSLYVTGNARVQQGLSLQNLYWALVTTDAYIWHPLTWISYLVDFELYGISSAGPWALTNVFWHGATSILLIAAPSWIQPRSTRATRRQQTAAIRCRPMRNSAASRRDRLAHRHQF